MIKHTFVDRGGRTTILFIHGLGADRHSWDGALTAPELAKMNLLIPDLPGHGESQDYETFGLEQAANELVRLCEHLKLDRCAVVAHSMGGAIGILFAEQFPVTHFVNAVGNLVSKDTLFSRSIADQALNSFTKFGFDTYKSDCLKNLRPDRPPSSYPASLAKIAAKALHESAKNLVALTDGGNLLARFVQLSSNKIYLQDQDNPIAPEIERRLKEQNITRKIVPNSGHGLMDDNPRDFYRFIAEFLSFVQF